MSIETAYFALLISGLSFMLMQLFVRQKKLEHVFFAIFSGSIAMVAVKFLGAELLGPYRLIVGLFTCATCNVMWLTARTIFHGESSIQLRHVLFAVLIAVLVMISQGLQFAAEVAWLSNTQTNLLQNSLSEFTQLMSSTVLVLTFWEAIRPNKTATRGPRYLYAFNYAFGVLLCTVGINAFVAPEQQAQVFPWFVAFAALLALFNTWGAMTWHSAILSKLNSGKLPKTETNQISEDNETEVANELKALMEEQKPYLESNLKMIDVASRLNVSEYKISRAIRNCLDAKNFNQFINSYRIEHAKQLLATPQHHHWTVLVIGMESGFSSVASFNRAFKTIEGCSPTEYRATMTTNPVANEHCLSR